MLKIVFYHHKLNHYGFRAYTYFNGSFKRLIIW